ncbi:MAG: right-handed parallel beta-helix repeat-containing protein [Myxococcota bacterium]
MNYPNTVFVSAMCGDDSNTGLNSMTPVRTIARGLQQATGQVTRVLVCAGTYRESVVVETPVSLLGGHDCTTWQRSNTTFGYPDFNDVNETTVQPNSGRALVMGTRNPGSPPLEVSGFTFRGIANAVGNEVTVEIKSASITSNTLFAHNHVIGAAASSGTTAAQSVGVLVRDSAAPSIQHNLIQGGGGRTGVVSPASIGLLVAGDAGSADINNNVIQGGSGTGLSASDGSVGLWLEGGVAPLLQFNFIDGGSGSSVDGSAFPSVGVRVVGNAAADVSYNYISGGTGAASSAATGPVGISLGSTGRVSVLNSRIFGGDAPNAGVTHAVLVQQSTDVELINNLIHGGNHADATGGQRLTVGIRIHNGAANTRVWHNTVLSGKSFNYNPQGCALSVHGADHAFNIQNNILFGVGPGSSMCFDGCPISIEGTLANNAMLSQQYILHFRTACATTTTVGSMQGAVSRLTSADATLLMAGNVTIKDNCTGDAQCLVDGACGTAAGCNPRIFAGFSGEDGWDDFRGDLTSYDIPLDGWPLAQEAPCQVRNSSLDLGVPGDHSGATRDTTPSMGAHEFNNGGATETCGL